MTIEHKNVISLTKETVTDTQLNFLRFCQDFGWGKLEVSIQHGEPVVARIVEQTVKFDN